MISMRIMSCGSTDGRPVLLAVKQSFHLMKTYDFCQTGHQPSQLMFVQNKYGISALRPGG